MKLILICPVFPEIVKGSYESPVAENAKYSARNAGKRYNYVYFIIETFFVTNSPFV